MRILSRIYNHLFNQASLITLIKERKIKGMDAQSSELYKFATLKTERNMKATILAYENLLEKYPNKRALFVFENTTQCEYASKHATIGKFLLNVDKNDKDTTNNMPEIEKFEHILNILNAQNTKLSDFYGKIDLSKNNALKILNEFGYNDAKFLEENIIVYLCPTKNSTECFARMLNGYFTDDLQPHQNYALIKFIRTFGYEFMGIGANLLLFYRAEPLKKSKIKELYNELTKVYNVSEKAIDDAIGFILQNKKYLILPYTNSICRC